MHQVVKEGRYVSEVDFYCILKTSYGATDTILCVCVMGRIGFVILSILNASIKRLFLTKLINNLKFNIISGF